MSDLGGFGDMPPCHHKIVVPEGCPSSYFESSPMAAIDSPDPLPNGGCNYPDGGLDADPEDGPDDSPDPNM